MAQTLAQKILQRHTSETGPRTGPDRPVQGLGGACQRHHRAARDQILQRYGSGQGVRQGQSVSCHGSLTPQKDIDSANQVMVTRKFAQEMGITHYYEGGDCGVEHALLPEQGLVGPGDIIVGADSHTCTYGGVGAFATGMGSTDIAGAMALGETWFKVPPSIRATYTGTLPRWVGGKDLMLRLIGEIGVDGALYKAIEFDGPAIEALDVEGRLTIANMAIEAGGKAGLFAADDKTLAYLRRPTNARERKKSPQTPARPMNANCSSTSPAWNRWWPALTCLPTPTPSASSGICP